MNAYVKHCVVCSFAFAIISLLMNIYKQLFYLKPAKAIIKKRIKNKNWNAKSKFG